ncbi:unnamed protein product [Sphagnum jensenii]|uniref:F-box domain-containing protein n=1 Tax=Sphagnum jensenii TaxID=128206 RepID=A0ABP0XJZ5_9BRYO
MAADDPRRCRPWRAWTVAAARGGETGQASGRNENASLDATAVTTDEVLLFGERLKGPLIAETDAPSFGATFPGQCSSTRHSVSPPPSPASQQEYDGELGESSSMLKEADGTPTFLLSLDNEPFFVEQGQDGLGTDVALKGKSEDEEDDVRFPEHLQRRSAMEALLALASGPRNPLIPPPPPLALQNSGGLPRVEDSSLLQRQAPENLEDMGAVEDESDGDYFEVEIAPYGEPLQGACDPNIRSAMQQLHFPETFRKSEFMEALQHPEASDPNIRSAIQHFHFHETVRKPDKLHRKRPKVLPVLSQRSSGAVNTRGSLMSQTSASMQSNATPNSLDKECSPPVPPPSSPPLTHDDSRDIMDYGDSGDDDDESTQDFDAVAMDDSEAHMDLTDDLLHKVFSFLDDTALCHAAMVCRQWRAASAHEDFWKSLNFEGRKVSHDQVVLLCVRYPKATELNLGGPFVDDVLVREAMRSLRNLEVLTLGRGVLNDGFFCALMECVSLQKLSITDAVLGSGGAQEIQLRHDSLRCLQIVKCRVLRIAIRCPQLETLSLKRTGTAAAMLHCRRLINLDVSACIKLSDAGVRAAATACPLLASLDMSSCASVSDETLREISLVCTHLRTLDASYCPNISLEGVRMPMLTDLRLHSCEGINSSSMAALSHCVMLEVLAMDLCSLLTAVTLDLPHLQSVSLSNNRKFVELTLRSPSLTAINLTACPALNRIDITSSSLEKLQLRQQLGLASMVLQCPWLREVDLTECELLTDTVCNVFSDGGGCPRLNSLTLDNCDGLTRVKLSTSSLSTLSLVGCRNILSLELSCPILQRLQLEGCDRLMDASFAPVGLLSLNLGICPHLTKLEIEAAQMTVLDLRGCGVLSQAAICCPCLLSLDASYCSKLGDDCLAATTAACPAIKSLILATCHAVGPPGLLSLKKLWDLTMLDLSYTFLTDLSPIFEACPRLKILRLSACKYLSESALDALHGGKVLSELKELDISYGSLGRAAIEGVLAHCPHLTHVSLNGCAHVTDHLWSHLACPPTLGLGRSEDVELEMTESLRALQILSCVGCPNIWTVKIPRDAACLSLSSLNLSLSINIREVRLGCINLTSLNLSHCAALVVLELDCPRLITLCLQDCGIETEMLEHAVLGCTLLETLDVRSCLKLSSAALMRMRAACPGLKRLYNTSSS